MTADHKKQEHIITVAILENNISTLTGLCMELDKPDIKVLISSDKPEPFLDAVTELHPEIAIMDLRIANSPKFDAGFDAIRSLQAASPQTQVIICTAYDDLMNFHRGLNLGMKAFVSKDINEFSMDKVVRIVADGGVYFGKFLQEYLKRIKELPPEAGLEQSSSPACPLSNREQEVLRLFGENKSNEEIGKILFISVNTVKSHLKSIHGKLNVKKTEEALRQARINGWLGSN